MLSFIDLGKTVFGKRSLDFESEKLNAFRTHFSDQIPTYHLIEGLYHEIENLNTKLEDSKVDQQDAIDYYKKIIKKQLNIPWMQEKEEKIQKLQAVCIDLEGEKVNLKDQYSKLYRKTLGYLF